MEWKEDDYGLNYVEKWEVKKKQQPQLLLQEYQITINHRIEWTQVVKNEQ